MSLRFKSRLGSRFVFVLAILGCILLAGATLARAVHLVSSSTGWVLRGGKLLLSNDAGRSFKDVTPSLTGGQELMAIGFYDGLSGGVAIESPPIHSGGGTSLAIAATSDGGKSWTLTPIWRENDFFSNSYAGKANLSFVTPERGFALFELISGSASSAGALFSTGDAGKTWTKVSITDYGTMQFVTADAGWLVGGPGDRYVLRTVDGGLTWKELTLPLPPDIKPLDPAYFSNPGPMYSFSYQHPLFSDLQSGTVEVVYFNERSDGRSDRKVGRFSTRDGGNSWKWLASAR